MSRSPLIRAIGLIAFLSVSFLGYFGISSGYNRLSVYAQQQWGASLVQSDLIAIAALLSRHEFLSMRLDDSNQALKLQLKITAELQKTSMHYQQWSQREGSDVFFQPLIDEWQAVIESKKDSIELHAAYNELFRELVVLMIYLSDGMEDVSEVATPLSPLLYGQLILLPQSRALFMKFLERAGKGGREGEHSDLERWRRNLQQTVVVVEKGLGRFSHLPLDLQSLLQIYFDTVRQFIAGIEESQWDFNLLLNKGEAVIEVQEQLTMALGLAISAIWEERAASLVKERFWFQIGLVLAAFIALLSVLAVEFFERRKLKEIDASRRVVESRLVFCKQELALFLDKQHTAFPQQMALIQQIADSHRKFVFGNREILGSLQKSTQTEALLAGAIGSFNQRLTLFKTAVKGFKESIEEISLGLDDLHQQLQPLQQSIAKAQAFADQTNLVALNASIEAERVGEAGLGFASIAGEMRQLGDKQASSVAAIGGVVGDVISIAHQAIVGCEKCHQRLEGESNELAVLEGEIVQLLGLSSKSLQLLEQAHRLMEAEQMGVEQEEFAIELYNKALLQFSDALERLRFLMESGENAIFLEKKEVIR